MKKYLITIVLFFVYYISFAQEGSSIFNDVMNKGKSFGGQSGGQVDSIKFEHRDDAKDSFTISYKLLDSIRSIGVDNSYTDFYKYFSIPANQQYLGNNGAAGYSLLFTPIVKTGFDAGFHAYDAYIYTLAGTKFYKTTKPYTQINYQLASGKEQLIKITHTQNPRPNVNIGFEYRLINAPGFFITQNTNHNNYRIFSNYQSKRKRYAAYFTLLGNSINAAENGGIANDSFLTTTTANYTRRFAIPVKLGNAPATDPNPFSTKISTGNKYKNVTFFLRQYYDIGKKDSLIINDSTTEYLFYSKLRFQHTFTYNTQQYQFIDEATDSAIYKNWYDTIFNKKADTLTVIDKWKMISNDFSLVHFPDIKNVNQYILAGAKLENYAGTFTNNSLKFYNIIVHGEYRNKTKNKLWDILAKGEFYINGYNTGDYSASAALTRILNNNWGSVSLLFNNVNRSPSFIYNTYSSFNFGNTTSFKKENITTLQASTDNKYVSITATNYLITNYSYFTNYYKTAQYSRLINLLQITASKKIKLNKRWHLYTELALQQTDAAAPIRVPLLYTRNRIAYEGTFFKNLNLSTGIECRYYTPYKAYNYSPVMGQFMPQDSVRLSNKPDISAFAHFKIKSFIGYIRAENLQTVSFKNGFGFTNNNFAAINYLYPGFIFRFGIQWQFIN